MNPSETFLKNFYVSFEKLEKVFDQWLNFWNHEISNYDYRNRGRGPIKTIETGKRNKEFKTLPRTLQSQRTNIREKIMYKILCD
jgi:hypothetical protein